MQTTTPTYRPTRGDRVEVFDQDFDWVGNGTVVGYLDGVVAVQIDQGNYRHVTLVERVHPLPPPKDDPARLDDPYRLRASVADPFVGLS